MITETMPNKIIAPSVVNSYREQPKQELTQRNITMLDTLNQNIQKSVSSDRSILNMSIMKQSRFLRVVQGLNLFIRENWFVIRPVMIFCAIVFGVLVLGPAMGLVLL